MAVLYVEAHKLEPQFEWLGLQARAPDLDLSETIGRRGHQAYYFKSKLPKKQKLLVGFETLGLLDIGA